MITPNPQQNTSPPHKIIGVGVVWNQEKQILIDRRLPTGSMSNLWEFPGGKMEEGETIQDVCGKGLGVHELPCLGPSRSEGLVPAPLSLLETAAGIAAHLDSTYSPRGSVRRQCAIS